MEGCFTFQWGGCFSDGGASFLSSGVGGGGVPHGGVLMGGGRDFQKKSLDGGEGAPPMPSPHYGKPYMYIMLPEYACELFFYKLHIEN